MGKEEREEEKLTEADRRALRGSRFAPLPSAPPPSRYQPRLAHPGGPLATNKAAALAKFLQRKLQEPGGLSSIDPDLLEVAVKNAKDTLKASTSGSSSNSGRIVRHVNSFGDSTEDSGEDGGNRNKAEATKRKKCKEKKNKRKKDSGEGENRNKAGVTKQKKCKKEKKNKRKKIKLSA